MFCYDDRLPSTCSRFFFSVKDSKFSSGMGDSGKINLGFTEFLRHLPHGQGYSPGCRREEADDIVKNNASEQK